MFNSLTSLFKQLIDGSDLSKTNALSPNMAIACLLCEVSGADHLIDEKEESTKRSLLMKLLELNEQESEQLLAQAKEKRKTLPLCTILLPSFENSHKRLATT